MCVEEATQGDCVNKKKQQKPSNKINYSTLIFVDVLNIGHWEGHGISSHLPMIIL